MYGEGVRYRDSKLLVLACHVAVRGLRMRELLRLGALSARGNAPPHAVLRAVVA